MTAEEIELYTTIFGNITTTALLGILLVAFVKGIIVPQSQVTKSEENSLKMAEIVASKVADDVTKNVNDHFEANDKLIAGAVKAGIAEGIKEILPIVQNSENAIGDRLRSIEISIAELKQHQRDTQDRL